MMRLHEEGRGGKAVLGWISLGLVLVSVAVADEPKLVRFDYTETHMGSPFHLVLYTADETSASRAARAAFARIATLDAALSDYNPESELMRLCDKAGSGPVAVSEDLFDALDRCVRIAQASNGAFDPTIAPVVRLWRRARRDRKLPEPETLAKALSLVGYSKMTLNRQDHTVDLRDKGMKLDLGGMAKGMASQAAIDALRTLGVTHALVAGAGDIAVSDAPPGTEGWTIEVAPLGPNESFEPIRLALANRAISTSGDAEQFVEIDGKRYGHIVDPKTGLGLIDRAGVTVIASDGATADSVDTAAFVLGMERGMSLIESTAGASAIFVRKQPDGTIEVKRSRTFDQLPRAPGSAADATLGPR